MELKYFQIIITMDCKVWAGFEKNKGGKRWKEWRWWVNTEWVNGLKVLTLPLLTNRFLTALKSQIKCFLFWFNEVVNEITLGTLCWTQWYAQITSGKDLLPCSKEYSLRGTLTPEFPEVLAFQVCMVFQRSPSIHVSSLLWTELNTPRPNLFVEALNPNVTFWR